MAKLIQFFLNEGASGAASGSVTNSGTGGGTATITTDTGFNWITTATNKGLDYPPSGTSSAKFTYPIQTGGVGAALSGAQKYRVTAKLNSAEDNGMVFRIGDNGNTVSYMQLETLTLGTNCQFVMNGNTAQFNVPSGEVILQILVDSTAGANAAALTVIANGTTLGFVGTPTWALNAAIPAGINAADVSFFGGNRAVGGFNYGGELKYIDLWNDATTFGSAATVNTNLAANDDADPYPVAGVGSFLIRPRGLNGGVNSPTGGMNS